MTVTGHFRVTWCPLDGGSSQREIPEDSSAGDVGGIGGAQRAGGEWLVGRLVGPSRGGTLPWLVVVWLSAAMRRLSGTLRRLRELANAVQGQVRFAEAAALDPLTTRHDFLQCPMAGDHHPE